MGRRVVGCFVGAVGRIDGVANDSIRISAQFQYCQGSVAVYKYTYIKYQVSSVGISNNDCLNTLDHDKNTNRQIHTHNWTKSCWVHTTTGQWSRPEYIAPQADGNGYVSYPAYVQLSAANQCNCNNTKSPNSVAGSWN